MRSLRFTEVWLNRDLEPTREVSRRFAGELCIGWLVNFNKPQRFLTPSNIRVGKGSNTWSFWIWPEFKFHIFSIAWVVAGRRRFVLAVFTCFVICLHRGQLCDVCKETLRLSFLGFFFWCSKHQMYKIPLFWKKGRHHGVRSVSKFTNRSIYKGILGQKNKWLCPQKIFFKAHKKCVYINVKRTQK